MTMDVVDIDSSELRARLVGSRSLFSVSELYHENSKIIASAPGIKPSAESILVAPNGFKRYMHSERIGLGSRPSEPVSPGLSAITQRRSCREYSGAAVGLGAISELLFYGGGLSVDGLHRCSPSAGGLYPLEFYAISLNVGGLGAGAYHYDVREHGLSEVALGQFRQKLGKIIFIAAAVEKAAAVLVITGVLGRSKIKYGERGYRFTLLEAGHAMQNICLAGTVLGLGTCPVGGFVDDGMNEILDVDGVEEAAIYAVTVGVPA
jgi:SagB-type dehydrogenase family enzyme